MTAVNAVVQTVTDYGTDPHNPGGGAVRDAMTRLHGFLIPVTASPTDATVGGRLNRPVQDFHGAASPRGSYVYADGTPDISDALVTGPQGDPARRLFAARLRRRLA